MQLGRISRETPDGPEARLVAVDTEGGRVIDLRAAESLRLQRGGATAVSASRIAAAFFPGSMSAAIATGEAFLDEAARASAAGDHASLPLDGLRWLAAIDPPTVRDCVAFKTHIDNMASRAGREVSPLHYEYPRYYKGSSAGLIGHDATVPWPPYTEAMDYELELGFVIGPGGHSITPNEALGHVFGVTIYDDFSARDIQGGEMASGFGPAKGKDFGTAVGPWITTRDELDVHTLEMRARVNGEEWSHASSSTMWWSPEELIGFISWGETLLPGDLIGSGTVGFGCGAELGRFLKPGDVVELEVSGIGVLRNTVGEPEPRRWQPEPRPRD